MILPDGSKFRWLEVDSFGDTYYRIPETRKRQEAASNRLRRESGLDHWEWRAARGCKTHKRYRQYLKRQEKAALRKPMHHDESDFDDPRLKSWKHVLQSVPANVYSKKIGPLADSKFADLTKQYYQERLPCRRTFEKHGRFYSDWTSLPSATRRHLFNGDYSIDIKSCHWRIFVSLCRIYLDRAVIDRSTGEVTCRQNPVDQTLGSKSIEEYFHEFGIEKWLWKPLINACLHGFSESKIKVTLNEYGITKYPEIFRSIVRSRYIIETKPVFDAFGSAVLFTRMGAGNGHRWHLIYNSFEFFVKYTMFIKCKYGRVLLDLHDGVIFQLRDKRDEARFLQHIDLALDEFNQATGFCIEVEKTRINCLEAFDQRDHDVREFMRRINLHEIPSSDPVIVDELIKNALENCGLSHLFRPDWVPLREEEAAMG